MLRLSTAMSVQHCPNSIFHGTGTEIKCKYTSYICGTGHQGTGQSTLINIDTSILNRKWIGALKKEKEKDNQ